MPAGCTSPWQPRFRWASQGPPAELALVSLSLAALQSAVLQESAGRSRTPTRVQCCTMLLVCRSQVHHRARRSAADSCSPQKSPGQSLAPHSLPDHVLQDPCQARLSDADPASPPCCRSQLAVKPLPGCSASVVGSSLLTRPCCAWPFYAVPCTPLCCRSNWR